MRSLTVIAALALGLVLLPAGALLTMEIYPAGPTTCPRSS